MNPAPSGQPIISRWLRKNLFRSPLNSFLTLITSTVLFALLWTLLPWIFVHAQWQVVQSNLQLLLIGRFPPAEIWRLGCGLVLVALVTIGSTLLLRLKTGSKWIRGLPIAWLLTFVLFLWLLGGGLGLSEVSKTLWNGLLLTLLMAIAGITLSFPLGLALALGRRSQLPVIRVLSILYIEIIRGLPLIGILFSVQVLLPLILPNYLEIDSITRAIAGLTVFSAAYLAENVRGGLQALPPGQIEASKALGIPWVYTLVLIVLPQALRAVIPAIVGQFIGLFKDTSLLSLVGLFELTGMARSVLSQPDFIGRYAEVYAFIGLIYWVFCSLMAWGSGKIEAKLTDPRH
jgi:general L-amino acid transport system permease protein